MQSKIQGSPCPSLPGPLAVDIKAAAKLMGLSQRTVWKLVESGELRVHKARRRVIFPLTAINDFLENRVNESRKSNS